MRSKIAIVLAILGLVVLGLGIGQRTIWLPPATVTAGVQGSVTPSPLTVIGPDVLKAKDGNFTMTIKAKGPIQLAVAQQRDITGWVGDAAHTDITGVNSDFTALTAKSIAGAAKVPNPAGSDMWVSEEKGTGELSYTWQAPGHGDWALLVSSDGTAPAPTDITLTTDNAAGTPWAVPLMVIGSALLALAALLLFIAPRKPQAAVAGRRAAGRAPSDPAMGAVEVEKLVADRERAARDRIPKPATIADARRAARRTEAAAVARTGGAASGGVGAGIAGGHGNGPDHASALPGTLGSSGPGAAETSAMPVPGTGADADAATGAGMGSDADTDAGGGARSSEDVPGSGRTEDGQDLGQVAGTEAAGRQGSGNDTTASKGSASTLGNDAGAAGISSAAGISGAAGTAGAKNSTGTDTGTAGTAGTDAGASGTSDAGKWHVGRDDPSGQGDSAKRGGESGSGRESDGDGGGSGTSGEGSGTSVGGQSPAVAGETPGGKGRMKPKRSFKRGAKNKPAEGKSDRTVRPPADAWARLVRGVPRKARWAAALVAVLVAGTMGPAVAADPTTPASGPTASSTPSPSAGSTAGATAAPTAGLPVLLDSQVQKIAAAVSTVVASGDNAKNAKELEPRVAGLALQIRAANYKIRSKVSKQAAVDPVNSTKLLARVVTTDSTWPRSAMIVTQGEGNALPQLLTLVQASARENYKLINATPLLPGQTFPTVDKEGAASVPLNSATGLQMSPKDAIAALSDRLTKADSKWKSTFKDSVYIPSVLNTQAQVLKEAKDATYVFSHTPDMKTALAMRTADGGAMVVAGYTFGIDATSKAEATLTIGADAAVFAGGTETTKGFVLSYAEPIVMYIPPASAKGQISIVSANRNLIGAKFK
ncbi:hypothetical protein [Arthrobacter dokdonensis]|uniref:hypothetical protein n=1 Tax=Arthrobacter dokdonellae TaxID=2211210 RepID=UPI001013C6F5|nr:hypothetical protein [Arthrobacter dokdonellae]